MGSPDIPPGGLRGTGPGPDPRGTGVGRRKAGGDLAAGRPRAHGGPAHTGPGCRPSWPGTAASQPAGAPTWLALPSTDVVAHPLRGPGHARPPAPAPSSPPELSLQPPPLRSPRPPARPPQLLGRRSTLDLMDEDWLQRSGSRWARPCRQPRRASRCSRLPAGGKRPGAVKCRTHRHQDKATEEVALAPGCTGWSRSAKGEGQRGLEAAGPIAWGCRGEVRGLLTDS